MTESFTSDLRLCDFDATFITYYASMLHAFVFPAKALPVCDRPEYLGAKQTIPLRFKGAVIYSLRLQNLAK